MAEQEDDLLTSGTETTTEEAGNPTPEGSGETLATPVVKESTKERPGWMDQLNGDQKDNEALYRFPSVNDAVNSLVELEGKLGKSVTLSDDPTEEELSRLHTALGVPENQDGYDFSDVELPKGIELTEAATEEWKTFAKENDMTVKAAKNLVAKSASREADVIKQVRQAFKTSRAESEKALRAELGANYDKTIKGSQRLVRDYGDEDMTRLLRDTGAGNAPAMIRFLGKISAAVSEGDAPRGEDRPKATARKTDFPGAERAAKKYQNNYND